MHCELNEDSVSVFSSILSTFHCLSCFPPMPISNKKQAVIKFFPLKKGHPVARAISVGSLGDPLGTLSPILCKRSKPRCGGTSGWNTESGTLWSYPSQVGELVPELSARPVEMAPVTE